MIRTSKNHHTAGGALAYFTDCAIATLSSDGTLASCSKTRRERFRSIASLMLESCKKYGVGEQTLKQLQDRYDRATMDIRIKTISP